MMRRFPGLTSRWMMPALCSAPSPTRERADRRAHAFGVDVMAGPDAVGERAAAREVHDEKRSAVVELTDVVDRDDVWAAHPPQQLRFTNETLVDRRIARVLGREDLDGDVRFERLVVRGDDDSEAAGPQHRNHSVPADRLGHAVHTGARERVRGGRRRRDSRRWSRRSRCDRGHRQSRRSSSTRRARSWKRRPR